MPEGWEWVTQAIGGMGMIFGILSFQAKSSKKLLILASIANIFWAIHYVFLTAYVGILLNLMAMVRNLIYNEISKSESNKKTQVALFFVGVTITVSLLGYQDWRSILPMIGSVVDSLAFAIKDSNKIRKITLISSPLWMTYNLLSGSIVGTCTELFYITSKIVGIIRYRNHVEIVDRTAE